MNSLEDEIRGALRTEATRLREVRPLRLPAAARDEPLAVTRASVARWLFAWRGPAAAAAAVVLIAVLLVIVRSAGNEHAAPVAPPSPIAGPPLPANATPRYYVRLGPAGKAGAGQGILVGDAQTGRTVGTYPLHAEKFTWSLGMSGAGDDRTFVVSVGGGDSFGGGDVTPGQTRPLVLPPPTWYLVRIFPGTASPVRVTRLAVDFTTGGAVREIALSADGTELAVLSATTNSATIKSGRPGTSVSTVLGVYSVATGRLQHSWSAALGPSAGNPTPVSDLSWVGDGTVGFAVTDTPGVREEVRTVDTDAAGTSLLAASRVVWSQYVPAPPRGSNPYQAPQLCGTPFLTGNGQAVVCATSSYSARDKRQSAVFLAYPLATPDRPRVIGTIPQPQDVNKFNSLFVAWTNPAGTGIIGSWNPSIDTISHGVVTGQTVHNFIGFIGNGTVRPFTGPLLFGPNIAW